MTQKLHYRLARQSYDLWFFVLVAVVFSFLSSFETTTPYHDAYELSAAASSQTSQDTSPAPVVIDKIVPDYAIPPITDGLAPLLINLPTKQPVVFLGIDDGVYKDPRELQLMKANHIKATLFLDNDAIRDNPAFFQGFTTTGSLIEDHTLTHPLMSKLSYEQQKTEICGQADLETAEYGRRPVLFRPPGGDYNVDTQRAAADCGMKAVVLWIAKANGGSMQYQVGQSLNPGDIVLMHFRPEFASDMQAFIDAQNAAGLHTELLEDWLPASD